MPGRLIDLARLFGPLGEAKGIGLAVSGGADSLALMLLAARWRDATPAAPPLFVYSVDHGLRPEAAGEVAFVLAEAAKLGLPARALHWEGEKPATGVSEAARAARYRLIGDAMRRDGADVLVTAHHLDDQAETVLMRLAHGSGLAGLRGMAPLAEVEGVTVARPLLGISRAELAALVAEAGLSPVADPSNADPHYERIRWRQAMPQLAALGLDAGRPVSAGVHDPLAADFPGQHHPIRRRQGFARHPGLRVPRQEQVDDGVGDAVRDLVWMALGNAFRGEEEGRTGHGGTPGEAGRPTDI